MRRVIVAVSTEVIDCPRLFTLTPVRTTGWRRLRFHERRYRLVLWCEDPDHWHPWPDATYQMDMPKEWLVTIAPYASLAFKALRLVVPVGASLAGLELSKERYEQAEHQLDLMKTLVEQLPEQVGGDRPGDDPSTVHSGLTPAQGEALRGFRLLLFRLDRSRAFGGLRRFQAPSGEFLWICPEHRSHYDPGLPVLPA
jgi:hypothetical protein